MPSIVTDYTIGFRPSSSTGAPPQGAAWMRLDIGTSTAGGDYLDIADPSHFLAFTAVLAEPRPVYFIKKKIKALTTAFDATPIPDPVPSSALDETETIRWYQVLWGSGGGWIRLYLARPDFAHVTIKTRKPLEFAAILRVLQSPSPHYYKKSGRVVQGEEAITGYPL
ncbi:MAG: hypothetical protein ACYC7A_21035 [Thermoanaerobaculia bacterium]